ncbi:hypothetical protein BDW59DRAFT_167748 [Aspergillus cavernicola]|uniref:Integral membrane protein n=1 Tax=Aspergillus cavernicola TaxID=176166 RepID=A0ABR4HB47_9EURO
MELPYRPSKYTLRAPPPIPPRPGSVPNSGDAPPVLPSRPSFVSEEYPPPRSFPIQQPAASPPYNPAAYAASPVPGRPPQPPHVYHQPHYPYSPAQSSYRVGDSQEPAGAYSQAPSSQRSEPISPGQTQSTDKSPSYNVPFETTRVPEERPSADPITSSLLFERTRRTYFSSTPLNSEPISASRSTKPHTEPPPVRPSIQYDPPATFTLRDCPSTTFPLTGQIPWYILPEVPNFRVCSYCYNKHIRSSRFQADFHTWISPAGTKAQCLFNSKRIEDQLWPWALRSDNLQELAQFFRHRLTVRNCSGDRGVSASENVQWYRLKDRSTLPQFVACQACYEDVLLATPIRDGFIACAEIQPKDSLWSCDVALPFIRRLALKTNHCATFAIDAAKYLQLPPCAKNGEMVDGRSRKWYQPRLSSSGVTICEHCYGEYAVRTDFEHQLEPVLRPHPQHQCILGLWQASCFWAEALERKDFSLWESTMVEFVNTPPCTAEIPHGATAYQIQGVNNFDMCQRCYVGLIKPHGLAKYFKAVQSSPTSPRACDLNAAAARFASYAAKIDEAMITCTLATFTDFAANLCNLDLCPRLDLVKGRRWYGDATSGFRICPACYEEVVRGSDLARHFPSIPVEIPGEEHCDLYSARMRGKWAEACEKRDPAIFTQFAAFRKSVYDQTVPEMRNIVAMAKLNLNMQKMYNVSSSFYNNMDGMTASMYSPYISYGAAGIPHRFDTPWGVHGAQLGRTAQGYGQGITGDTARVAQLQAMWDQVE